MRTHSLPRLTQAAAPLTREVSVVNEFGETETLSIPGERALTVYVDKRELVTLMTLGARPELLVLGYLLNQRLIDQVSAVESVTVDWEVGAVRASMSATPSWVRTAATREWPTSRRAPRAAWSPRVAARAACSAT